MNFVWGYLIIATSLLIIVFIRDKDLFTQFVEIYDLSEERKALRPILYYPLLLIVGLIGVLLLTLLICLSPILFYRHLQDYVTRSSVSKDRQERDFSCSVPRPYTPYYDILFFSLIGQLKMEHHIVENLINKYDGFDHVAFPILFDHTQAAPHLFEGTLRTSMEEQKIAFFLFDIRAWQDIPFEEDEPDKYLNSNTNFSWLSRHLDASASTLSYLLGIPIDGENRLVLIDKSDINRLLIIPLDKNIEDIDFSDPKAVSCSEIILDKPYYNYVAQFLSLRWANSTMEKNKPIKICAEKIRSQLYDRYRVEDPSVLNIFKLTEKGPKPWTTLHRSREPSKEEEKIGKAIFNKSYDELLSRYPGFNESDLDRIQSKALETKLKELALLEGIEYESKIFLKSANTVYSMFAEEEDVEEMDYSPVAIGYTKFFEKEINLSVVQAIRKELGITMPEYYNKHYPKNGSFSVKINENFKVDYNMKNNRTGKFLAPGLGQTFHALKVELGALQTDKHKMNELLIKGRKLNTIRNRAAHPELIGKEDLDRIRNIIVRLYLNHVFHELIKTKSRLKK